MDRKSYRAALLVGLLGSLALLGLAHYLVTPVLGRALAQEAAR